MKRAVMAVVGTVAGLVALLGYKSSSPKRLALVSPQTSTQPTVPPGTDSPATNAPATNPPATNAPTTHSTHTPATAPPATHPPTTAAPSTASRTLTGPVEENRYGPVQVQLTVANGHITSVTALQLPTDRQRSAEISQEAGPILHDEVMQAQSGNIDTVSGATYTSEGYAQSVQAALDQARA